MKSFKTPSPKTLHLSVRVLGIIIAGLIILALTHSLRADEAQQVLVSSTPVSVDLPSPLPFVTEADNSTPTPTRTATPIGPALLEALSEANVRAQPDTNSDKLGAIESGDVYPVIGKYYQWYKFQYDKAPGGIGWVFGDLVKIIGDATTITDLTLGASATTDPLAGGGDVTAEVTQLPGGISLPVATDPNGVPPLPQESGVLPTFTFPPDVALLPTPAPTALGVGDIPEATANPADTRSGLPLPSSVPPIAPILILGGLGLLGLFVSSYKR